MLYFVQIGRSTAALCLPGYIVRGHAALFHDEEGHIMLQQENLPILGALGISDAVCRYGEQIAASLRPRFDAIDEIAEYNQAKVLAAMQKNRVNAGCFAATTGYGYNDVGRDTLERVYADCFHTEAALVRPQITCGTHALAVALSANLLPGDELLSPVGRPYDTLEEVIGIRESACSLKEYGVTYDEVALLPDGSFDYEGIRRKIKPQTRLVTIQRSKGYATRPTLSVQRIGELIAFIKGIRSDIICMVDNCYGEFVERIEPSDVGADMIVGSLIKNPGGAIAPSGGYLVGREDLIERASYRLTAPGIGKEVGPSLISNSSLYQGIFNAPHVVAEALKGSVYISAVLQALGYEILPKLDDPRSDIVELICFHDPEPLKSFCRGIQKYSPVDSHVIPEAWDMPGYENQVIMASGGFVEGSSIELSADGPLREPYICYVQGGTSFPYIKLVMDHILKEEWNIV